MECSLELFNEYRTKYVIGSPALLRSILGTKQTAGVGYLPTLQSACNTGAYEVETSFLPYTSAEKTETKGGSVGVTLQACKKA